MIQKKDLRITAKRFAQIFQKIYANLFIDLRIFLYADL